MERDSPATQRSELGEAVGIETIANVFTPLLERGCPLPCETTATFGTAEDGQEEILIFVFRTNGSDTDSATALGAFEITGFPPASGEGPEVAVTFSARGEGIFLSAEERTGVPIRLERLGP